MNEPIASTLDRSRSAAPTLLEQERRMHEAFAVTRRRVYIESQELGAAVRQLDEAVSTSRSILITGESGCGKSSLVANWAFRFRQAASAPRIIEHYVGIGSAGAHCAQIVRRLIEEIRDACGLSTPISEDPDEIIESFPMWLARSAGIPMVLVIDGLDQIDLKEVGWIPEFLPNGVVIVASVSDDHHLSWLDNRDWLKLELGALTRRHRSEIVRHYVASLEGPLHRCEEQILERLPQTATPLFLCTGLEELKRSGCGAASIDRVEHLFSANGIDELFDRVLSSVEADHGARVVESVLSLLTLHARGLTKSELVLGSGSSGNDVARLVEKLSFHLIEHRSVFRWSHERFREAVATRYVTRLDRSAVETIRHRIIDALRAQSSVERVAAVVPYQLLAIEDWTGLESTLTDPLVLEAIVDTDGVIGVQKYWLAMGSHSDSERAYADRIKALDRETGDVRQIANAATLFGDFLEATGKLGGALTCYSVAITARDEILPRSPIELVSSLVRIANVHRELGAYAEAHDRLERARALVDPTDPRHATVHTSILEALARWSFDTRDLDAARELFQSVLERSAATLGDASQAVLRLLNDLAAVEWELGNHSEAERLSRSSRDGMRAIHGEMHPSVAEARNNLAVMLAMSGRFEDAAAEMASAKAVNESLLGPHHPVVATNLVNLSYFFKQLGRIDEATSAIHSAIEILRRGLGERHTAVASALVNLSAIYLHVDDYPRALEAIECAAEIRLEALGDDHPDTIEAHLMQARIAFESEDWNRAIELLDAWLTTAERVYGENDPRCIRARARRTESQGLSVVSSSPATSQGE